MKNKKRLNILYLLSFVFSVFPLALTVMLRWNDYADTKGETVKLLLGGSLGLLLIFLKVIDKLKISKRVVRYGLAMLLSYLLYGVIKDIVLLTGMAFVGELIDSVVFVPQIAETKNNIEREKTATLTKDKIEELLKGNNNEQQ